VAVERIVDAVEVQEDAPLRLSFTVAQSTWPALIAARR
jgi:hypothetical protein